MRQFKFLKDKSASMLPIFAISLTCLITAAGVALDYSRVSANRSDAQNALDSAVLAAAITYQETGSRNQASAKANEFLNSNWHPDNPFDVDLEFNQSGVTGTLSSTTDMTLMKIAKIHERDWKVISSASYTQAPLNEFALALDISNSMKKGGHMAALRSALKDFSKVVYEDREEGEVSVTLVPFANAVSFPSGFSKWLDPVRGYSVSPDFNGCFYDEPNGYLASTSTSLTGKYIATPNLVLNTNSGANLTFCPKSDTNISLFVTKKNNLNRSISSLKSYQGTNTASGMSWAWRALDPDWRSAFGTSNVFPLEYDNQHSKNIVLLTDGLPYERPWSRDKVSNSEKDDLRVKELEQFASVCEAIQRDNRVNIFVIGYGSRMTADERVVLRSCVAGDGQYYDANASSVSKIFKQIARKASRIALTR